MSKHFTTCGNVRGECGHKHRTPEAAWRCLQRDCAGCRQQGGYSDRVIVVVDGEWTDNDRERLYALMDA